MSYIEQSLAPNEHVVYRARFHWLYDAAAWLLLIGFAVAAITAYAYGYPAWTMGALIAFGVFLFLAIKLPIWAQRIVVTNQRLIYRRGLVRRSTEELQLRSAEQIQLEQGILGRIFGFGRVIVSGTGMEDVRLPALAEPVMLSSKLQEAISSEPSPVHGRQF